MTISQTDKTFAGSIPQLYERYLVPLIFEAYADDLATRLTGVQPERVLEVAAGTGAATRAIASRLPEQTRIVATDLNVPMIEHARAIGTARTVEWRQADAMALPFEDHGFDAVVCQFGAMFFPDRAAAYAEMRRVLRPGGILMFSVWDRIEDNEFADVVTTALSRLFPGDPPRFLARTPHGYHDKDDIRSDLVRSGLAAAPEIDTVEARSRAASHELPAIAYCHGTPLRSEIEGRAASALEEATQCAAEAIGARFGYGAVDGRIQAHVVTVAA